MAVDFMIVGARNSGTSTLSAQLSTHPQICFAKQKEPKFFSRAKNWKQEVADYEAKYYAPNPGQLCGEASHEYSHIHRFPNTPYRLHAYNPDLRIIYIMRNPIERIRSHYANWLATGLAKGTAQNVIFFDPGARMGLLDISRYGVQIRPYIELFGKERVKLIVFKEFVADQAKILCDIATFLGIAQDGFYDIESKHLHPSTDKTYSHVKAKRIRKHPVYLVLRRLIPRPLRQYASRKYTTVLNEKPQFSRELREILWRFLEDDVRNVESWLGRRLDIWRDGYEYSIRMGVEERNAANG